jgi:hypothetical protein
MTNRHQTVACPRLHMGCGESLRSQLLLSAPRPFMRDEAGGQHRKQSGTAETARSRTRG